MKRPGRAGWTGSLGYRADPCRPRRGSWVATANGVHLPRDPDWKWETIRLDVYGGSARGAYRYSEATYGYLTDKGTWLGGMTLGHRVGRHRGLMQYERHFLGVEEGEPHFIWSVGTSGGQGYDVKTFTLVAGYRVFE